MVRRPAGKLSRYFYGIEYGPRDLRLAAHRSRGQQDRHAGGPAAALVLPLRPEERKYSLAVMRLVRAAGSPTVLALVAGVLVLRRRSRRGGDPQNANAQCTTR